MGIYRKKPVEINACLWDGNHNKMNEWLKEVGGNPAVLLSNINLDQIEIHTLEGTMVANVGDYIIRGIQGEFYPCKPDIFKQTYDLVR